MFKQILVVCFLLVWFVWEVLVMLGIKFILLIWGMKDVVFRLKMIIFRLSVIFFDYVLVELFNVKYFIQEDVFDWIVVVIIECFG